jgi:hypothetical protein
MTPKPHELSVPVTAVKTLPEAKEKAKKIALAFYGAENADRFVYVCKGGIEQHGFYVGEVVVYFDEYGEEKE